METKSIGQTEKQREFVKRRSLSVNTGVELIHLNAAPPYRQQTSVDDYVRHESTNVSAVFLTKLRHFRRQLHRHMLEAVNASNDVSRALPRSAVGDIYFRDVSPITYSPKSSAYPRRSGKLSLDLHDNKLQYRHVDIRDELHNHKSERSPEPSGPAISTERRLSKSAPELEINQSKQTTSASNTRLSSPEPPLNNSFRQGPREVTYDEDGRTWEIYGAEPDPNALGHAIESHLEKLMQRTQREQRCFSVGSEVPCRSYHSTKSSSRASHTGEHIFQSVRQKFRRRAVSTATTNSSQTPYAVSEGSPGIGPAGNADQPRRRSRILTYINRILRRSSTSVIASRRRELQHQDSIVECGEPPTIIDKVLISTK